jgi:hypothetical protein
MHTTAVLQPKNQLLMKDGEQVEFIRDGKRGKVPPTQDIIAALYACIHLMMSCPLTTTTTHKHF